MRTVCDVMPAAAARTLFLRGQGLLDDPDRPAGTPAVLALIRQLGFVQLDSINIVERAHHHILWTRLHGYRPGMLDRLQRTGRVFEGFTHDASFVPSEWFVHWQHRFAAKRSAPGAWLTQRLGQDRQSVLDAVLERVRKGGPVLARDFEHNGARSGPWWDWKPAKAALEYWWRTGVLAILRRGGVGGFEKVYDLTERVLPTVHALPAPSRQEHVEWACRTALERLGAATPREIAAYWALITAAEASSWCHAAAKDGRIVPVGVEGTGDRPGRIAYAACDWHRRAEEAQSTAAPAGLRLLSPFDPVIRDRARCLRLFGFDYRFEAFVPQPKRRYGYYVLPMLEIRGGAARFVGRLDPRLDRDAGVLYVRRVWWEPGVRVTRGLERELDRALSRYAALVGAASVNR